MARFLYFCLPEGPYCGFEGIRQHGPYQITANRDRGEERGRVVRPYYERTRYSNSILGAKGRENPSAGANLVRVKSESVINVERGVTAQMGLEELQAEWSRLAETDPLWAIAAVPGTKGNRWDVAEFFRVGERRVDGILAHIQELKVDLATHDVLDFGCGVGRATQAFAKHFSSSRRSRHRGSHVDRRSTAEPIRGSV